MGFVQDPVSSHRRSASYDSNNREPLESTIKAKGANRGYLIIHQPAKMGVDGSMDCFTDQWLISRRGLLQPAGTNV